MYVARPAWPIPLADSVKGLYTLVYNKYFVDEIYDATVVKPVVDGSRDGALAGHGRRLDRRHRERRRHDARAASAAFCGCMQSGNIRSYATWVLFGSVLLIVAHRPRGRPPMNLLLVVLFLPLAGFLAALAIPRSSPQASRVWALARLAGDLRRCRSACWPGSTAAWPASSSRIDVPWIAVARYPLRTSPSTASACGWSCSPRC